MNSVKKIVSMCALLVLSLVSPVWANQSASLSWTANTEPDLAGYNVYRSSKPCPVADTFTAIATTGTQTTFLDDTIPDSWTSACYAIDAQNLSGLKSGKSQIVSKDFTPAPVFPPIGTPALSVTPNDTSLVITWPDGQDGAGGKANIDIRYSVAPILWGSAVNTVCTVSPCTIIGLTPDTAYELQGVFYRGVLNSTAVFGPISGAVSVRTKATSAPPAIPGGLQISSASKTQVVITASIADCKSLHVSPIGSTRTILRETVSCVK